MIRVLLCSEGVTEHGHKVYDGESYSQRAGVLQILIQRCARDFAVDDEFDFIIIPSSQIMKHTAVFGQRVAVSRDTLKARALAQMAKDKKCDHIAYHRDEDHKGFDAMYAQVEDFLKIAREIGKKEGLRCITIIPQHMTESWLLASPEAFPNEPDDPRLPKNPENLSKNEDSPNHPKKYIERVLAQFDMEANATTFAEIAEGINIDTLRRMCPISFGRFYEDMQGFVGC